MRHRTGLNGTTQISWLNVIAMIGLALTVFGGAWVLFQNQFSNLEQQMRQTDADLIAQIKDDRLQTDRLRDRVVPREENTELVKRLDAEIAAIQKRIDIIETTRPTTGELQSAAASIKDQIAEMKERLRFLEQVPVLKPQSAPSAATPKGGLTGQ